MVGGGDERPRQEVLAGIARSGLGGNTHSPRSRRKSSMPWPGMQRGTIEKVADLQSASEAYKNLFLLAGMVVTPPCFLGDTDTHDLARLCATDF